MTYQPDCTASREVLDQLADSGLEALPEAIRLLIAFGDTRIVGWEIWKRGTVFIEEHDLAHAADLRQGLHLVRTSGDRPGIAMSLIGFAALAVAHQQPG